jgi:NTP pyrophosphatase (non-canonical NTP hydrolase)
VTLARLRADVAAFAEARDWNQFHTPRNLTLALTGEVGELAECFQWRADGDCAPGLPNWSDADKHHLGEELSDCACTQRCTPLHTRVMLTSALHVHACLLRTRRVFTRRLAVRGASR